MLICVRTELDKTKKNSETIALRILINHSKAWVHNSAVMASVKWIVSPVSSLIDVNGISHEAAHFSKYLMSA